eukprot:gene17771-9444_t
MREAAELCQPTDQYFAQPLEDNIFEWHFTVRGPPDTDFAEGRYHGRILLPPEYPMKPPSIMLLTPNGRFEIGKKICLSMSAHHPETWQPSWSIRTVLLAIIGFMPSKGEGAIGALEYRSEERKRLAKKSFTWVCSSCGSDNAKSLVESNKRNGDAEDEAIASQINFVSPPEETASTAGKNKAQKKSDEENSHIDASSSSNDFAKEGNEKEPTISNGVDLTAGNETNKEFVPSDTLEDDVDPPLEMLQKDGDDEPGTQEAVRRRINKLPKVENSPEVDAKNRSSTNNKERGGTCIVALIWIIILLLVILIFRRLCMDILVIDGK